MPTAKKSARPSTRQPPVRPIAVVRRRTRHEREVSAWLAQINPLRDLTVEKAQQIFDAARRGNDVRLQCVYANMEEVDPTLLICAERRAGALIDLDWTIRPKAAARAKGFDQTLADEQAAFLEQVYGQAEERNLFPAIEHLASAFFRGHAHVQPKWSADGQSLLGFDLLDAWNVCRDVVTGLWHWNPEASETVDLATLPAIPPRELVTLVRTRHVDYPAMAIYLRAALGEKAWGRFLERYGVPPVIITMPPDMDPARVSDYCAAAEKVADGGTGALPAGSLVTYATEARGTNPFSEFLLHQQKLVVLMATGGMLTSLDGATGIGQGATDAHEETWRTIVRRDAGIIATALNRTVTDTLLDRAFPGRPHLAAFDFETEPAPGPAEVFDLAAKAVQAGYRVTQAELQERTGYALEAAGAGSGGLEDWRLGGLASPLRGDGPTIPQSPRGVGQSLTLNRQTSNPPNLQTSGLQGLAEALQADCAPLAEALRALLAEPSPTAAQALAARLPDLLPDDPEMAAAIEEALTHTFGDTLATAPEKPAVANKAPRPYRHLTQEEAQSLYDELVEEGKIPAPTVANREGECHAKDPANCPYHGTGRFAGKDGKPAEGKAKPAPKELPPRPNAKASAADYRKANLTRGEAALGNILADHADVPAAMVSRKLGPIDFVWGREGNPGRDYEGGYGFSHIIAKHGEEAAQKVPKILAFGKYFHDEQERDAYTVVLGNEVVSVKRETGNFLVVTSYASDKKATAYLRRGGQIENKAKDDSATF